MITSQGTPFDATVLAGDAALADATVLAGDAAFADATVLAGDAALADATVLAADATVAGLVTPVPERAAAGATMPASATSYSTGAAGLTDHVSDAGGPLHMGQAFGQRYHIIKLLGVGGMGAVYQAWDAELGVAVALKVIRVGEAGTSSPDLEKRFKKELLLARKVTHKNVVRIHDLGDIGGIKYITMPYVQGDDLATILRYGGKLPIARALRIARQVSSGLEAAHEAGVVHRDLKPPNVMISGTGEDAQALIMDFGISSSTADTSGGISGTLEYMAPEQATSAAADARADIYAFGLILYEMLTGLRSSPASTGQDRIDAMKRRFADGLPPIRTVDPSVPEPLAAVVARCLERDAAARYQSATELSAALAALDDAGELIPIPPRFSKRLIASSVVAALALVTATWYFTRTPPPPKQHDPVSVVIADIENRTGDQTFDHTLEPMLKLALEESGFISAYDRNSIRNLAVRAPAKLDEKAALEIAVKQGLPVVLSGSLAGGGGGYTVSVKATQSLTGEVIADAADRASRRDQVLGVATKLAARVRKALGDEASDSGQIFVMDTLSATSLDVVRQYAVAQEALSNAKFEEALQGFSKAVALDPAFGMGYHGMAVASRNLDRQADAEKYIKEALRHLDRMTERERYRTRGFSYRVTGDYQACAKEYGDLVARFAGDVAAHNQVALCSTHLRTMQKAVEEMRHVVTLAPKGAIFRINLALYSSYASDFDNGEREARTAIELGTPWGWQALALAQTGKGLVPEAADVYTKLGQMDGAGPSYAVSGVADLAAYEGRFADAARMLSAGAEADVQSKESARAAAKFAALGYVQLSKRQKRAAIAAADRALGQSDGVTTRFLAGRLFAEAGAIPKARAVAATLARELQAEPQAYAKIIEGDVAMASGDPRTAIKALTEAAALVDTWIGRFDLGRAYLAASAFAQADSEFDRCMKRRGEALSLFLDEEPTYAYFPQVFYYQGRTREGLNSPGFAESYRAYLAIREKAKEDPLLPEIRKRIGATTK
jgi:serine/threonine-protein kinase